MTFEIALSLAAWALATCVLLYGTWLTLRKLRSAPPRLDHPFALYPISILKPLKGSDAGLRENLEAFFNLDYPDYELIFSVADGRDPARGVVESLMRIYPEVQARLLVGAADAGPNPKVNNLLEAYRVAANDWLLISDSNVRVRRDYLRRMMAHVDTGVGLVTAVVAGRGYRGAGGWLEGVYLNTFYARGMCVAEAAGHPCVVGKSMLFRRSTFNRFGGLRALARYLAEDYMAGRAVAQLGMKVVLAAQPVVQHIGEYSLSQFWSRHLRWGRIRKAQAPFVFLFEPFLSSIVSGLLGAWACHAWLGTSVAAFLAIHLGIWAAADALVIRKLDGALRLHVPLAWFARELSGLFLWLHTLSGNTVKWRGAKMRVMGGGILRA
jgi:ceramide glucosyltransferase